MAIVASERTGIQKLVIAMFNAAPGGLYLNEFTGYYEGAAGRSLGNLANILGQSTAFQALYPSFQTANEFAIAILKPYGLSTNQESLDFVTSKFATTSKAQIALQVGIAVDSSTSTNAALIAAKAILANKAAVSETYSVTNNTQATSLAVLQASISGVTSDPATVTTQNTTNASGSAGTVGVTLTLTVGSDTLSTTATDGAKLTTNGDDTIRGDAIANSLETIDSIDGGNGIDTLNVLFNTAGTRAPVLKSVEKIFVTTATNIATLSLASATGVTEVWDKASAKALTVTGINLSTAVGIAGGPAEATTFTFAGATGANDTATLALNKAATAAIVTSVVAIENLNVTVADTATGTSSVLGLVATDAKTITVSGLTSALTIIGANADIKALTTFNASGLKGDLIVDFSAATTLADSGLTFFASNTGVNTVKLAAAGKADVVVFNTSNVSTLNKMMTITNFTQGTGAANEDKINLAAFSLGADTTVASTVLNPTGDVVGFFTGTGRVVLNAGQGMVFVDINKDGNFNAGTDLAFKSATTLTVADFTAADLILA